LVEVGKVSNIRAIQIPYSVRKNPYQGLLSNSLEKLGVEVQGANTTGVFSLLRASLANWKPDIIHIHWQHPFILANSRAKSIIKSSIFILEVLILKALGIKIVWTVHNLISHEKTYQDIQMFFTRRLAHQCHAIIAQGESAKHEIQKVFNLGESHRMAVIPHGSYLGCYENKVSRSEAKEKLLLSPSELTFLYFGLIRPYKGVLELVQAFKKLDDSHAKLLIAGEAYNEQIMAEIRSEARDCDNIVIIEKFIPDDEVQVYMNAADVVVLPYQDILTSGAAMLAISFGKPVIAPAIGCIWDTLSSEGDLLYNPSENEGLLGAMRYSLKSDLAKVGRRNLELARELQWDELGKRILDLYQSCLGKPSRVRQESIPQE
jgi:beta-1,4-mannosyltransferase